MTNPNAITPQETESIATLGRLKLNKAEKTIAARQLSDILRNFSTIQAIPTAGVAPADAVSGLTNITREDISQPEAIASPKAVLDGAPKTQGTHIKVKGVFS